MDGFVTMQGGVMPAFAWASLPAAASMPGQMVRVTDVGIAGSVWISDGSKWVSVSGEITFSQSGLAVPCPSNTSENTLVSAQIKGGILGPNGIIVVDFFASINSSANPKVLRINIGGSRVYSAVQSTNTAFQGQFIIRNANSVASQKAFPSALTFVNTAAAALAEVDTTQNFQIDITGQLADSSDSLSLEGHRISVRRG